MNDFNPVTLFFILFESMGVWLWALVALALVLLVAIALGVIRLRKVGRSAKRPLMAALVIGVAATAIFTALVPFWTQTSPDSFVAPVDYFFAGFLALVPGGIAGAIVFFLTASRCAARGAESLNSA